MRSKWGIVFIFLVGALNGFADPCDSYQQALNSVDPDSEEYQSAYSALQQCLTYYNVSEQTDGRGNASVNSQQTQTEDVSADQLSKKAESTKNIIYEMTQGELKNDIFYYGSCPDQGFYYVPGIKLYCQCQEGEQATLDYNACKELVDVLSSLNSSNLLIL